MVSCGISFPLWCYMLSNYPSHHLQLSLTPFGISSWGLRDLKLSRKGKRRETEWFRMNSRPSTWLLHGLVWGVRGRKPDNCKAGSLFIRCNNQICLCWRLGRWFPWLSELIRYKKALTTWHTPNRKQHILMLSIEFSSSYQTYTSPTGKSSSAFFLSLSPFVLIPVSSARWDDLVFDIALFSPPKNRNVNVKLRASVE